MKKKVKRRFRWALLCLLTLLCLTGLCGCRAQQSGNGIQSLAELQGKTIAVQAGTAHAAVVKTCPELQNVQLIYGATNQDCLALLYGGKAEAMVLDNLMAQTILNEFDGIEKLKTMLNTTRYGFAVKKGNPLKNELNNAITLLQHRGVIDGLLQKWIQEGEKTLPEQNWPGKRGEITCRVDPDVEPICYLDENGQLMGLDIELLLLVARELDYHITFSQGSFEDLIPSVMAGQIDVVASGITITQERQELVDFTRGYLRDGSVVLVCAPGESGTEKGLLLSVQNSLRRTFVENDRWLDILKGIGVTILITLSTVAAGTILGTLLYLWEYSGSRVAAAALPKIAQLLVLMPLSTLLRIMFYLVFVGLANSSWLASGAALTLTFGFGVYGSLADAVGVLPKGQTEAAVAMGYSRYQMLWRIYLPQALPRVMGGMESALGYHVRDTSLVGVIMTQDIQFVTDTIGAETLEPFVPIVLTAACYMLIGYGMIRLARFIGKKICLSERTEAQLRERFAKGKF